MFKFVNKKLINNIKTIIIKFKNKLNFLNYCYKGQVMLLTVLILGGSILIASTIAGYLMMLKIRSSSDIINATKAIYAADAGIEWNLYTRFKDSYPQPYLSNGSTFEIVVDEQEIKSIGKSSNSFRAFWTAGCSADGASCFIPSECCGGYCIDEICSQQQE
ncbi:hypothetical protein JW698_01645 [Candidatus Wolfebacteria bacterium]|nr:hypothetical protein [Candidatus Wolfebacteria bacterium]